MASTEFEVFDTVGVPIKHWRFQLKDELVCYPVPLKNSFESLFSSFESFKPKEDDVWLCGYPKSGNHWLYENINILLSGEAKHYAHIMAFNCVEIRNNLTDFAESQKSPRIFTTHLPYHRLPKAVKEKSKIIVIIRNPKSVAVSYFHHMKNAEHNKYQGEFTNFLPLFLNGIADGYLYSDWFTSTKEYWSAVECNKNVYLIFFEEFVHNQVAILQEISTFLGLERSASFLKEVGKLTAFESLKNSWKDKDEKDLKLTSKMTNTLIYRKGLTNDWVNHFSDNDTKIFNAKYNEKMAGAGALKSKIQFQ